jgi:hypothetical protein
VQGPTRQTNEGWQPHFLKVMITKTLLHQPKEVFLPWQACSTSAHVHRLAQAHLLDNYSYPGMQWTSVEEVLKGLK